MSHDVSVIGNIVADLVVTDIDQPIPWGQLSTTGEPILPSIGGNGAIFSVNLKQLGFKPLLMGRIGEDLFGIFLRTQLEEKGLDTEFIVTSETDHSGASLCITRKDGERYIKHHIGANGFLGLHDIDFDVLLDAKALFVGSYFIMPGLLGAPTETIMTKAKEAGLKTFLDVAWDIKDRWRMGSVLSSVDYFMPNFDEARKITGEIRVTKCAAKLVEMGAGCAVISMGAKGCFVQEKSGNKFHVPAIEVSPVDATGAGDTFNAAFVYGILSEWDIVKTTRFANAAAALSVTGKGGTGNLPSVERIQHVVKYGP